MALSRAVKYKYIVSYLGVHHAEGIRVGKLVKGSQTPGKIMCISLWRYEKIPLLKIPIRDETDCKQ